MDSLLHIAISMKSEIEIIKTLLNAGTDPNSVNNVCTVCT